MTTKTLEKANILNDRIKELERMKMKLENRQVSIFLQSSNDSVYTSIGISDNMRNALYGMCLAEIAEKEKELEGL